MYSLPIQDEWIYGCQPPRPHQPGVLDSVSELSSSRCSGGGEDRRERAQACKRYHTPLKTLSLLDNPGQYLREGLSMNVLKRVATADAASRSQTYLSGCLSPRRIDGQETGPRKWRSMESPGNDDAVFHPQTLEIAPTEQRKMKIMRS